MAWIRSAYRRIMRATLLVVTSAALLLGFSGRWIIGIWAGKAAVPSSALLWSMCFWAVLLSITVNQATLLAATQRVQFQAVYASLTAILNLVLSIVLVQRFGAIGVLSATIISYLLCVILPQTWDVRRVLRGRYLKAQMEHVESIPEVSTYGI
jgi:O-antigen/teichoic acid export membrane protein